MLRAKLFTGFAILVLILSILSVFFVMNMIETRVIDEAQRRVQFDLSSAWAVYNAKLLKLETILKLAATKEAVVFTAEKKEWNNDSLRNRLEVIRKTGKLDFLSLVSPNRQVVMRTTSPYKTGDYRSYHNAIVVSALNGNAITGSAVLGEIELEQESKELAEKAFLTLENTPKARPRPTNVETRGLVMMGSVPIIKNGQVLGAVYGGILLNRNLELIDRIKHTIYKDEKYENEPLGTATIFLYDARVTTTVKLSNGNRALGSRVSKEVADRVLEQNGPWRDRAFVVDKWHLTAYDPIYDIEKNIIGMLYVGLLEKPFIDLGNTILKRYIWLLGIGLFLALLLAYFFAERLARPIKRLVDASDQMRKGENPGLLPLDNASQETKRLTIAFNEMSKALGEREANLKDTNEKLEEMNSSLKATNHSYMETLGFVSHELKSPISTILNYVYLLKELKIGPLTEKQEKAVKNIHGNLNRVVEMIRHYLNLSRIENGVLNPVKTKVPVCEEVLTPIIESIEADIQSHNISVENLVPQELLLYSDLNMTREVFENLISNAVKYGRDGGKIVIKSQAKENFIQFSVWNEGEGIPEDKIPNIFDKFSRLEEQKTTRRQKGTGLGLFITKHIVEGHGGQIQVHSKPNEWTEFEFTLPVFIEQRA